jgi:nuclear-control-of-ATPase protein 2
LEVSFRNAVEGQTLLCTHDGKSPELIFERLPEVDVESSEWTEVLSANAITLIYQNLQKFDDFISDQVINSPFYNKTHAILLLLSLAGSTLMLTELVKAY